jgi:hypothetical protein
MNMTYDTLGMGKKLTGSQDNNSGIVFSIWSSQLWSWNPIQYPPDWMTLPMQPFQTMRQSGR